MTYTPEQAITRLECVKSPLTCDEMLAIAALLREQANGAQSMRDAAQETEITEPQSLADAVILAEKARWPDDEGNFWVPELAYLRMVVEVERLESVAYPMQAKGAQGDSISLDARYKVLTEFLRFVNLLLESAKQSKSNPNACFLDWRDVCALRGDMPYIRESLDALATPRAAVPDGWTNEKPTESGWYWYADGGSVKQHFVSQRLGHAYLCVQVEPHGFSMKRDFIPVDRMHGKWIRMSIPAAPTEDKDHD